MATILKCKMCGGDVEVNNDMTVGTCLFCGSTMTLPRIDSEKKARLFNRANEYRLNNEFDKAYEAYKTITEEDEQEAEAYWGMVLSEYGIEYVEDPNSHKRVPTCHRTHVQSIRGSINYKLAIKYADAERKFLYQDEAEVLDKLQRSIISVSAGEEPYDVFISYKESTENGERTQDSVIAQDIYNALESAGLRVFFSRISLEDHIGENYEPYIFAALESAKVMLVVTTSGDNVESTWVRNEWGRFLRLMENHSEKSIVPVYKEMSPYELPEELTGYQAQDVGKIGAIQDLVHGVKKLVGKNPRESTSEVVRELVEREKTREEQTRKTRLLFGVIMAGIILVLLGIFVIKPTVQYLHAKKLFESGNYQEAKDIFTNLKWFDSEEMIPECDYKMGEMALLAGEYDKGRNIFVDLADYKDSEERALECVFEKAKYLQSESAFEDAIDMYKSLGDIYTDDVSECQYQQAHYLIYAGDFSKASRILGDLKKISYKDAGELQNYCWYVTKYISSSYIDRLDEENVREEYDKFILMEIEGQEDLVKQCKYSVANALEKHLGNPGRKDYATEYAIKVYESIKDYLDSAERIAELSE